MIFRKVLMTKNMKKRAAYVEMYNTDLGKFDKFGRLSSNINGDVYFTAPYNVSPDHPVLISLDRNFDLLWKRDLINDASDRFDAYDLVQYGDYIFIAGITQKSSDGTLSVLKINVSDGSTVWEKYYYRNGDDFRDLKMNIQDGNVTIVGYLYDPGGINRYIHTIRLYSSTGGLISEANSEDVLGDTDDRDHYIPEDLSDACVIVDSSKIVTFDSQMSVLDKNYYTFDVNVADLGGCVKLNDYYYFSAEVGGTHAGVWKTNFSDTNDLLVDFGEKPDFSRQMAIAVGNNNIFIIYTTLTHDLSVFNLDANLNIIWQKKITHVTADLVIPKAVASIDNELFINTMLDAQPYGYFFSIPDDKDFTYSDAIITISNSSLSPSSLTPIKRSPSVFTLDSVTLTEWTTDGVANSANTTMTVSSPVEM